MILTIFTPTYNRLNLLINLYESLINQKNKDFIWLVVDDGSTDGTQEYILKLKNDSPFPIKYYYQENKGKSVAHNTGVSLCETELFFCVDSDDKLTPDAVDSIIRINQKYENQMILGYFFLKMDNNGNISGGNFSSKNHLVGIRDIYHLQGFSGELAIVLKTKMIKNYSFPVFEGEKFVSELVLYNELNNLAPMVWVEKVIYLFEYQDTGYSKNSHNLVSKHPYGVACGYLSEAKYSKKMITRAKFYAQFNAVVKVFRLKKECFPTVDIKTLDKILSIFLKYHYIRIFKSILENTEE